jgi:hypothetical protein
MTMATVLSLSDFPRNGRVPLGSPRIDIDIKSARTRCFENTPGHNGDTTGHSFALRSDLATASTRH